MPITGRAAVTYTDGPSLKIGLCQVFTEPWKVEDNVERTLTTLEMAALDGADIAVTPECVFHAYPELNIPDSHGKMLEIAEPLDGPNLRRVRDKAAELEMAVVVGFAEAGTSGRIHNSAALIDRKGEIRFVYRKVHLRHFEWANYEGYFTPGDEFYTARMDFSEGREFNIGVMICFDREIPESVRCLRALGAEFIACPLATDTYDMFQTGNRADNEMITRCRAAENECFIAVVNHAGRFNGGSFLVGPFGECLKQMDGRPGAEVVSAPASMIQECFHSQPRGWMAYQFRRPEVYSKHLG